MENAKGSIRVLIFASIVLLFAAGIMAFDGSTSTKTVPLEKCLDREIELGVKRSDAVRYYYMETTMVHFEDDGKRSVGAVFKLWLEAHPDRGTASKKTYRYICRKFTVTRPGKKEAELPTLGNWSYSFSPSDPGIDSEGQVFGIPHSKFALLVDSRGNLIDSGTSYLVYNNFIDFHGLNDVFVLPPPGQQGGLQDLRKIGDRIVHAAANTVAPVGLGEAMKKGSVFRNGEVTLELKGLSAVDGVPCALLGYDSGDSSYLMYLEPMAGMDTKAEGTSHYFGDVYVELDSGWLRKATLHEFVVSLVTSGKGKSSRSVIERDILLETQSKADFDRL